MSSIHVLSDEEDEAAAAADTAVSSSNGSSSLSMTTAVAMMMATPPTMEVYRFDKEAKLPVRTSLKAAGYDLYSIEEATIAPGDRALIGTGLQLRIPDGFYGAIVSRSGLACHQGIHVGAGVVDGDFRGEVCCLLFNLGKETFKVSKGSRIAQLLIIPILVPQLVEVNRSMNDTFRPPQGFGSSGLN